MNSDEDYILKFWNWFFCGIRGEKPGITNIFNRWMFFHLMVAVVFGHLISLEPQDAAEKLLLPFAGVLVALTFAWSSNTQLLLQSDEIYFVHKRTKLGLRGLIFEFQASILIILTSICVWALASLGAFSHLKIFGPEYYFAGEVFLYFLGSLTLRECWLVILASQILLWNRLYILRKNKDSVPEESRKRD